MADVIYTNKMYAFHASLGYDKATIAALRRVVQLNCLLYVPQFLKAAIGADAPVNDLHFVKQLLRYRAVDRDVADTALKVLRRHGWYLTQELVVFCSTLSLFSDKVDADEKSRLAARLQTFRVPANFELGIPDFPDVTNDVAERGVKLVTDYMEILTKDDTTREFLLQGVELHRRKFPDFQKNIASAF
ncbi:hypothetical protein FJT64_016134 [Amphibalanus amphitrite]|uniref:Uncharacterized protein n=1 Tax=Amphibalanus amphitrite TaxID=1232801 RepID=A0A6A4XBE6_AMPAM|nr:hypothetical protein FJT64_016134 [Amphibalanus amphitrite]